MSWEPWKKATMPKRRLGQKHMTPFTMINHHCESSWFIMVLHNDHSPWCFIMMSHDGSSWLMMMKDPYASSWIIIMNRDDSSLWRAVQPWKYSFQGGHVLFAMGPMTFSKASFCQGRLFAMASIAFLTPFCHGSHSICPCWDVHNGMM